MNPNEPMFPLDSFVLAKISGYRPWPARVKEISKMEDTFEYIVKFYGTHDLGYCKERDLYPFNRWVIKENKRNRDHLQALYEKSLKQAEEDIQFLHDDKHRKLKEKERLLDKLIIKTEEME